LRLNTYRMNTHPLTENTLPSKRTPQGFWRDPHPLHGVSQRLAWGDLGVCVEIARGLNELAANPNSSLAFRQCVAHVFDGQNRLVGHALFFVFRITDDDNFYGPRDRFFDILPPSAAQSLRLMEDHFASLGDFRGRKQTLCTFEHLEVLPGALPKGTGAEVGKRLLEHVAEVERAAFVMMRAVAPQLVYTDALHQATVEDKLARMIERWGATAAIDDVFVYTRSSEVTRELIERATSTVWKVDPGVMAKVRSIAHTWSPPKPLSLSFDITLVAETFHPKETDFTELGKAINALWDEDEESYLPIAIALWMIEQERGGGALMGQAALFGFAEVVSTARGGIAQLLTSELKFEGLHVPQDIPAALQGLYEVHCQAAGEVLHLSWNMLGDVWAKGRIHGVLNHEAAAWYYTVGVENYGEPDTVYQTGLYWDKDNGSRTSRAAKPDLEAAADYYSVAAENGHPQAAFRLGEMILNREIKSARIGDAKKLLRFAARKRIKEAKALLRKFDLG
jgi:TPR repeat protein